MNRRELFKAAIIAPLAPLVPSKAKTPYEDSDWENGVIHHKEFTECPWVIIPDDEKGSKLAKANPEGFDPQDYRGDVKWLNTKK